MQNTTALKGLIIKNAHLFWHTNDAEKENLPLPIVIAFF
jgi:hypothetical protein